MYNETEGRNYTKSVAENVDRHSKNFIMLSSLALLINVFVVTIMLWNQKLSKRHSNEILLNGLVSNAVVCISLISFSAYLYLVLENTQSFYYVYVRQRKFDVLVNVLVCLSLLNFTLLTLDRLVAVKWPFFYEVKIQAKHIYFAAGFNWSFRIVFGVILLIIYVTIDPSRVLSATNIMFIVTFLCGFITLLMSNTFIFTEARKKLHTIEKFTVADREKLKENRRMFRKKELRIVKLNIGMIICFFLFWINALIVDIYSLALSGPMGFTYMLAAWYLVHIYYICNPMWYVSMNQDVKRELKVFFLKEMSRSP